MTIKLLLIYVIQSQSFSINPEKLVNIIFFQLYSFTNLYASLKINLFQFNNTIVYPFFILLSQKNYPVFFYTLYILDLTNTNEMALQTSISFIVIEV